MSLNDPEGDGEFDNKIEDEEGSIYPGPGEIGALEIAHDYGSGSYAEDGPLEVAEDIMNSVDEVGGGYLTSEDGQSEIGAADRGYGDEIGGDDEDVGSAAMYGPTEIGAFAEDGGSEIGAFAEDGGSEIGAHADVMAPFESFMLDDVRMGAADRGYGSEIGAAEAAVKVIETARDNRQPPPPMKAVDVDAPENEWDAVTEEDLTSSLIGAALKSKKDPFPLTSALMLRCGAGMAPRFVRVDTEESYKQFRTDSSPELAELRQRFEEHLSDPHAHEGGSDELSDELSDDVEDLVLLGAEVEAAEEEKRLDLWMPKHFDGLVEAWSEGDYVGASMVLPDGRIATTLEPKEKCVEEMGCHAAQAGVPVSTVVGMLTAMGHVLGAGTALKEMAAAAPSLMQRPESAPFVVRVEPKVSPALCALAMLAMACKTGNAQACSEWQKLSVLAPAPVKQAMNEAVQLAKAAG